MTNPISTWGQLLRSNPRRRVFLDEFTQGGEYAIVRIDGHTTGLLLGSAIKAAPRQSPKLSKPLELRNLTVPVLYGELNVFSRKVVGWDRTVQSPSAENLGLVQMPNDQLISICVPLRALHDMEFATLY